MQWRIQELTEGGERGVWGACPHGTGVWRQRPPAGVQGQSPRWGVFAPTPEAEV